MKKTTLLLGVMLMVCALTVCAADWKQYLGPNGDSTSDETGLARTWPEEGPKILWRVPLGPGYGAPAIDDGKVYMLDRIQGKQDVLRCYDLETGKEEWNFIYDADGQLSHKGSRSVPAVNDTSIFTVGPHGDVYCFDKATHKPVWNINLTQGFGDKPRLNWGFGQNPLLYKDMLIVTPMTPEIGVMALNLKNGEIIWKTPAMPGKASYCTPAAYTIAGDEQIVMISAGEGRRRRGGDTPAAKGAVFSLDPKTGKQLWSYDGWQCQIPIPNIVPMGDGRIFITGGYEAGSAMIRVTKKDSEYNIEELYKTMDFGVHCHPPILYKGYFYAHSTTNTRREGMTCFDPAGKVVWQTKRDPAFDKGGFLLADGLMFSVDGNKGFVYLIEPSPEGYKQIAKVKLLEPGEIWAPVTLVDGKLFVRDHTQMLCLDIR